MKNTIKRFLTWNPHGSEGFTLVELIVVIAILAILAAVAIPAYSGYIEKANRVANEALLNDVNTAFASACAFNGDSHIDNPDAAKELVIENNELKYNGIYVEEFNQFYSGGKFEDVDKLVYVPALGVYELTVSYVLGDGSRVVISERDAELLKNSVWAGMGSEKVLQMIAGGADGVAMTGTFSQLLAEGKFKEAAEGLGLDYAALNEDYAKAAYLKEKGKTNWDDLSPLEKSKFSSWKNENADVIEAGVSKNLMAVVSAKKGQEASKTVLDILTGENAYETLQGNVAGGDFDMGMAENALAFGLYTAYAGQNASFQDMKSILQNPESAEYKDFMDYLNDTANTGKVDKDLESLLAAMNVIGSQDADALHSATVNGMDSEDLQKILASVFGEK